ncbi:MAG: TGS domain-containing protein [Syntrophotaleaceae bacterium]
MDQVKRLLLEKVGRHGIKGVCYGRYKHLYSIHRKMVRQQVSFDEVYDLIAFRVIVQTVAECYTVLGLIHAAWKPVPGRFKDFIAMPKPNMYQSLHTTVIGPFGERMEVQIRTEEMHRIAEEGIAAHWRYKESQAAQGGGGEADPRGGSLRQMVEAQQGDEGGSGLLDALNTDLFSDEVYVFTPKGTVKAFPRGATPIDFAYSVHTDVGHRCSGARVNGKLVPLKTELHNGDIVEVITSAGQKPSKDWLKFVKTSRAASKIRQWVKTEQREKSILLGRELLEKRLRKYGFSLKRALQSAEMATAMQELGYHTSDDLLAGIGYGKLSLGQVVGRVVPDDLLKPEQPKEKGRIGQVLERIHQKPSSAIKIQGLDDIMVRYAKCCNPLPGDPVVGFITRGRGITVHAADCPGVIHSDPQRRIDVEWDWKKKSSHRVKVRVFSLDQKGILANISGAVSNCEANILSANVHTTDDSKAQIDFTIDVQDREHLNRVTTALQQVKGVSRVQRMRGNPPPVNRPAKGTSCPRKLLPQRKRQRLSVLIPRRSR